MTEKGRLQTAQQATDRVQIEESSSVQVVDVPEETSSMQHGETRGGVGNRHNVARSGGVGGSSSRTILCCVPRTVSTALTKCLSAVDGIQVWFEPYTYCLAATTLMREMNITPSPNYEGNENLYRQIANRFDMTNQYETNPESLSYASIKRFLEESKSPHIFVKDMAYSIHMYDGKFLPAGFTFAFLIRHPLRVMSSFRQVMFAQLSSLGLLVGEAADEKNFDVERDCKYFDDFFEKIYDVWNQIRKTADRPPIVIDSDDLLAKPAEVLPKLCDAVGLPFDESMLCWDASPELVKQWVFPAKGIIEKLTFLYGRAITSSDFLPPRDVPDRSQLTPDVIRCSDKAMKYYNEMYDARVKF